MASTVIKTVKPGGGGDYASLSAWEAGENGNLVGADEIRVAECYGGLDATAVTISGGTVDATRYLIVRAAAGAEAQMPYDTSGVAYRIEGYGLPGVIYHNQDYTQIRRIQVQLTADDNAQRAINTAPSAVQGVLIFGCSITQTTPVTFGNERHAIQFNVDPPGPNFAYNNFIVWDNRAGEPDTVGISVNNISGGGVHEVYNNTVIGLGTNAGMIGIRDGNNIVYVRNNLVKGCGGGAFSGVNFGAYFNNAADDATTASHTTSRASQTFTFAAAGDYHLASTDAGALGFGEDLSGATYTLTTDFDGQPRGATWDIGADQFVSVTPHTGRFQRRAAFGLFGVM
jgi:hypothetical protein